MLPTWAAAPGKRYEHGDNYSDLEVVWTDTESGDVQVQTALGYIDVASDGLGLGPLAGADAHIAAIDSNIRLAPVVAALRRQSATRVQLACFSTAAAVLGALGGTLGAHLWHP